MPKLKLVKSFQPDSKEYYLERTKRNQFWLGGPEGQNAVRELRIAIAGLGGMGSNIAEALARMGVGELRIADPDHIDVSNINRQVIANPRTVGKSKAKASADELLTIAEDLRNRGVSVVGLDSLRYFW